MNPLEITIRKNGEVDVLTLRGGLVLGAAVNAMDETFDNLASHGSSRFILSMDELKKLD